MSRPPKSSQLREPAPQGELLTKFGTKASEVFRVHVSEFYRFAILQLRLVESCL
jgi:hypothetical protein